MIPFDSAARMANSAPQDRAPPGAATNGAAADAGAAPTVLATEPPAFRDGGPPPLPRSSAAPAASAAPEAPPVLAPGASAASAPSPAPVEDAAVGPEQATIAAAGAAFLVLDDGARFPIAGVESVVGRGRGCDVRVDRGSVSRAHGVISRRDGGLSVRDLGSHNGTFVNDERVLEETRVYHGDRVRFGQLETRLEAPGLPRRPPRASNGSEGLTVVEGRMPIARLSGGAPSSAPRSLGRGRWLALALLVAVLSAAGAVAVKRGLVSLGPLRAPSAARR